MLKYLKYFIPAVTGLLTIYIFTLGEYYPTIFFICFSTFLIIGDWILPRDMTIQKFSYPFFLNLSIYINLPILSFLVFLVVSFLSGVGDDRYIRILEYFLNIDYFSLINSFNIIDKVAMIIQTTLSIGMLGTVPGHELTHRKKNKFDMFLGNWLLAFSCDCTFAIEHVYGHHKNVCLPEDPASAKRKENIYAFIINAIIKEQSVGWRIENKRLDKNGFNILSLKNRMIIGYLRSIIIMLISYLISGALGLLFFLIIAFLAKSLLEGINYIEHYGLVRVKGKPVRMRHSWNSNHALSSLYLCNVNRHSDHHRASYLNFWELNPYHKNAPMLPYGYLGLLYLVLIVPFLFHKIMDSKIIDWDNDFASIDERKIIYGNKR